MGMIGDGILTPAILDIDLCANYESLIVHWTDIDQPVFWWQLFIDVPRAGDIVFYFPQGHTEQLAYITYILISRAHDHNQRKCFKEMREMHGSGSHVDRLKKRTTTFRGIACLRQRCEPTKGKTKPKTIHWHLTTKKGQVYNMHHGKRDVDTVSTMGNMEDVSIASPACWR
ncbi:hypothetical protein ACFE04_027668 [Oxalis oulophora]